MDIYAIPDTEVIGCAGESGLFYEFNEFIVLLHAGAYYWSSDSGCSCPSPFEDHQFPGDFESGNAVQALNALDEWSQGTPVDDDGLRTRLMSAP